VQIDYCGKVGCGLGIEGEDERRASGVRNRR
jgi:hypothetical protein